MKRLTIILLSVLVLASFSACKDTNTSSVSSDTTSTITEKDIFEYNGTESEYNITESEAEELFKNQPTVSSDETTSKDDRSDTDTESKEETSSEEDTSNEENTSSEDDTSSQGDTSSLESDTTDSSSSAEALTNKFDKDGDGWTDGWQ